MGLVSHSTIIISAPMSSMHMATAYLLCLSVSSTCSLNLLNKSKGYILRGMLQCWTWDAADAIKEDSRRRARQNLSLSLRNPSLFAQAVLSRLVLSLLEAYGCS